MSRENSLIGALMSIVRPIASMKKSEFVHRSLLRHDQMRFCKSQKKTAF
jgi:hypothetical protein